MTKMQRLREIIAGLLMLLCAALIMLDPEDGYITVTVILSVSLLVFGVRWLVYYLTMARHMVNGRWSFYTAAFLIDLGIFTGSLTDVPRAYVMIYLIAVNGFSALVSLLRVREIRSLGSSRWRFVLAQGITGVIMTIACIVFYRSISTVTLVFGIGLAYSACVRIAQALRRTAIVYIPS